MVEPIDSYYARYDEDMRAPEKSKTNWSEWGKSREQACRNMRNYAQYRECGFTGDPVFDEYGWIKNEVPKEQVESVTLFGEGASVSSVECLQLPNGRWVSGMHYMLAESGCACGCSIWGKQHDSRMDALVARIKSIIEYIKHSGKEKDKAHLASIFRAMDDLRQLSLF